METEDVNFWKEKYENADKNLQNLKDLAHKAIADYEDLKKKYDQNHKQHEALQEELTECREQLQQVQKLVQPVYEEYKELETKFEIENQLKNAAENYATKVTTENQSLSNKNKKLQRQSQMLLDLVGDSQVSIPKLEEITREEPEVLNEIRETESLGEHFNQISDDLRDKLAEAERKLKVAEENCVTVQSDAQKWKEMYEVEKVHSAQLKTSLSHHQTSFEQLSRVSVLAVQDYDDLKQKYELEHNLKNEAENLASKMLAQKNAMQRQSMAAIMDASKDSKLNKAFQDIEELEKKLEEEKTESKRKIEELEESLNSSKDVDTVTQLQNKLDTANDQITDLQKQVNEITMWRDKYAKENERLTNELDVANQRLKPPPPPPPPPLPPILKPLKSLITKKKKSNKDPGSPSQEKGNPALQAAMVEMMQRIKSGDPRSTLKPASDRRRGNMASLPGNTTDTSGAHMEELGSILKKMKRSNSVDRDVSKNINNNSEEQNELQQVFSRVKRKMPKITEDQTEETEEQKETEKSSESNTEEN